MNVQPQATNRPAAAQVEDIEHHKLIGVRFVVPLQFAGVIEGATIAKGFTITPARLTASLDWRECKGDEAPTGIGLAKMAKTAQGGRVVMRAYTPLHNVVELQLGE